MTALTIDDLALVLEGAYEACAKWHDLGLALRVPEYELESIESQRPLPKDGLRVMLATWLKRVEPQPTWAALVKALASKLVKEGPLAKGLEEKYCRDTASCADNSKVLTELKENLEVLCNIRDERSKAVASQQFVKEYMSTSLASGASVEYLEEQLQKLCKDDLISEELHQQSRSELHPLPSTTEATSDSATAKSIELLFNKDTVYHAGICSLTVCTRNPVNYLQFLNDKKVVPGHTFKEMSLSQSKQDRYLIARQDNSTIYLGFQSEPLLLEWSRQFKSFSEGIAKQCRNFPTRFIVELLNKQQRIVLTGFSFGGLLACAVTASVWETPYISTDLLRQNLVCITFGQPHVSMPMLDRVVSRRPELVSTIHSFHCEDDPVPRLLRFLDVSWSQEGIVIPDHLRAPLQDPISSDIMTHFGKLQQLAEAENPIDEVLPLLSELTSRLERVVSKLGPHGSTARQLPPRSTSYLLSTLPTGLTCTQLSQEEAALQSSFMKQEDIRKLSAGLFEMHSVLEYTQVKLFFGYLDKTPKYSLPSAPAHPPGIMVELKPSLRAVDICRHGNETAVVLEGENLWFCHQVTVGGHHEPLPAQKATAVSIQFNVPHKDGAMKVEAGKVSVSLLSQFSRPVKETIVAIVEEYDITTRQEQLAQLTPSELIEMAYLCALLEQQLFNGSMPLSHKFKVIRSFLEGVVHVVPLESLLFAIANGSHDTAMSCVQALMSCRFNLPVSELMGEGLSLAAHRMSHGISESTVQQLRGYEKSSVHASSKQVSITLLPHTTGRLQPLTSEGVLTPSVRREILSVTKESRDASDYLRKLTAKYTLERDQQIGQCSVKLLCGLDIVTLYPTSISQEGFAALRSPLSILSSGREELTALLGELQVLRRALKAAVQVKRRKNNQKMLEVVNKIRRREVDTCASLLGAFMQQEEIGIKLADSKHDTSEALSITAAASVGVWALFSLDYSHVQPLLVQCKGQQLLVMIEDYIKGKSGEAPKDSQYAAKLQFIVQGMRKTVTCNSRYISYSLEQQLVAVCKERKIDASIPLNTLLMEWSGLFEDIMLSLVHEHYRPLIARWLKWALMIHNLREELAKYTAIGVVGLVNSGKSKLVNRLFGIQIPVGTAEASRTTVPFLYNLDEHVKGLDVVDFPGVDDEDDTIPDLADLLVTVAQIVIFVVDYRRVGSQSAKQWLDRLQREKVPVLVCLTFADRFYAEHMSDDGQPPKKETMKYDLEDQLTEIRTKIGSSLSYKVQFFSFSQDKDSILNSPDGRQRLEEVGIGSPRDVGAWLVKVFQRDFKQEELASQLKEFIYNPPHQ